MRQLHKLADTLGVTIEYLDETVFSISFDDLLKDRKAQIVFRNWIKLSSKGRQELANFACCLVQQEDKRIKGG